MRQPCKNPHCYRKVYQKNEYGACRECAAILDVLKWIGMIKVENRPGARAENPQGLWVPGGKQQ